MRRLFLVGQVESKILKGGNKMKKSLVLLFALALVFGIGASNAAATQIGAGSGIFVGNDINTGGARLNIDQDNLATLAPGTYDVLDAEFNFQRASQDGDDVVRPFLAIETGINTYETLWAGDRITPGGAGIGTTTYALGTEQFTLAALTDVLAGFWQGDNVVFFNNQNATLTAHDSSSPVEPNPANAPGEDLGEFNFANLNNRTYLFEINVAEVAPVPEPGTLLLLGFGLAGLGFFRMRKKTA